MKINASQRVILIGGKFEDNIDKFQHMRDAVEKETNRYNIIPHNPEVLRKTEQEKAILKDVKKGFKILKQSGLRFKETRDEIIHLIVKSRTPDFGSLKILVK